jgi:hypothetical protein
MINRVISIVPQIVNHYTRSYTGHMSNVLEGTESDTLEAEESTPKFAHYAEAASVTEGYIMGRPVMAICGKLFVPSRDPNKFPICPICKNIAEALFLDI